MKKYELVKESFLKAPKITKAQAVSYGRSNSDEWFGVLFIAGFIALYIAMIWSLVKNYPAIPKIIQRSLSSILFDKCALEAEKTMKVTYKHMHPSNKPIMRALICYYYIYLSTDKLLKNPAWSRFVNILRKTNILDRELPKQVNTLAVMVQGVRETAAGNFQVIYQNATGEQVNETTVSHRRRDSEGNEREDRVVVKTPKTRDQVDAELNREARRIFYAVSSRSVDLILADYFKRLPQYLDRNS